MPSSESEIVKELTAIKVGMAEINTTMKYIQEKVEDNRETVKSINTLTTTINSMLISHTNEIAVLQAGQKRTGERLEILEKEPAHAWKNLKNQIVGLVTSGLIGAVVTAGIVMLRSGGAA